MSNVKIFADSTSDLTKELYETYDISVVPLYVNFYESSYKDKIDLTTEELYRKVDEFGILPKTAAPSPSDFYNAFKPYIDKGLDIIYIGLSSKLSSAIQNASIAAAELPEGKIEIIDSLNVSSAIGLLLLEASDLAKRNFSLKEISSEINNLVSKVKTTLVLDTLDYVYKGGRCTSIESFFGSILKIKPILRLVDGNVIVGEKLRGKREKTINALLELVLKNAENINLKRLSISHSLCISDAKFLKKQLEERLKLKDIIITDAGCVISSHCGPGTVGIMYISK